MSSAGAASPGGAAGLLADDDDGNDDSDDDVGMVRRMSKAISPAGGAAEPGNTSDDSDDDEAFDSERLVGAFDNVVFAGDFNYRVDDTREHVEATVHTIDALAEAAAAAPAAEAAGLAASAAAAFGTLLDRDQLNHQRVRRKRVFQGFSEGKIAHKPTFKYDPGSDTFDSSSKQRIPAFCDRILFKGRGLAQEAYTSIQGVRHSDHRPVWSTFELEVGGGEPAL